MGEHKLDLANLIGSRICHDLISPIGAITNGLELLSMSGASLTPEMALISDSVEAANARIRFFRIAYGPPDAQQQIGRDEIRSILADITKGSRLSLTWLPSEAFSRDEAQLAFLAIQCAEQALPYGGEVLIQRIDQRWHFELIAERLMIEPALWDGFNRPLARERTQKEKASMIPAHVQFLLLPIHAGAKGRRVEIHQSETTLTLTV